MSINVYAVGRSGSGKSTAVRYMKKLMDDRGYSTTYIKDYTILLAMSKQPEHQAKFRSNEGEGFDILDPSAYDIALEQLLAQIKYLEEAEEYDVIFVEFARRTYKEPFTKLSEVLRSKDYILFVEAKLEICIERIAQRTTGCYGEDRHYISDAIMNDYFSVDNLLYMNNDFAKQLGLPSSHLKAISNEDSVMVLKAETKNYTDSIFQAIDYQPEISSQVNNSSEILSVQPIEIIGLENRKFSDSLSLIKVKKEQPILVVGD